MKKYACNRLYKASGEWMPQSVVSINERGEVERYAPLKEETSATEWLGGIIILSDKETLNVTVESGFKLTNENGDTLSFALGNNLTSGSTVLSVVGNNDPTSPLSGSESYRVAITEEAKYPGIYTGTLTFTITVNTAENN